MSLCLRPLRLRCPRRIRTAAGCRAGRLPARRQPAEFAAANPARAARRNGLPDRPHAPGRPRHDAPRPAARECGICLPCPPGLPLDTCAARFRLPERGTALCRRGRGARQLAGGFLPALRPARGALPRHPRGDRLREPEYRGRRRGGVQHRPRKDQPEPCRVDAAAYGLLYGAFGAAGRRPARGGNPGAFRRDARVARRPRQPQLGRGMDRRPLVFHGILPFGARPCLVSFGCRAGLDDRMHGIFAVSFRPTGDWFPMVWSEDSREVHGVDVSQRYRDLMRPTSIPSWRREGIRR